MSWQPLCASNPIPGNPDGVAVLSKDLASVASELREQTLTLQRISSEDFWEGKAADEFREHQTKLPPYLEQLATRYEKVSDALGQYHPELHEAQQEAYRALMKAREAEEEIRAAELRLQQKQQWEADERCRVETWNAQNPKEPPLPPEAWPEPDPAPRLLAAQEALREAHRELECAIERYEDAARRCARQIESAIDDELKNESGWFAALKRLASKIVDALPVKLLAEILEWLAIAVAAIGVVLMALGITAPIGAILLGIGIAVLVARTLLWLADEGPASDIGWAIVGLLPFGVGKLARHIAKTGRLGRFVMSPRVIRWAKKYGVVTPGKIIREGVKVVWKFGKKLWKVLEPEPERRPRCDLVPSPCIYRPPRCPKPSPDRAQMPVLEVAPGRVIVGGPAAPRDVAVLHHVAPGGIVAASPQQTAPASVLQGA